MRMNACCMYTCIYLSRNHLTHSRIFWLENTAPPLREDHWVKLKKDWRTYHRLLLFHSIAMHQADKLNATMTVIPAFRSTLAFFDKICDCAHYPISGEWNKLINLLGLSPCESTNDPITHILMHQICILSVLFGCLINIRPSIHEYLSICIYIYIYICVCV